MKNFSQIVSEFHYSKISFKNCLLALLLFLPYLFYSIAINFKNFIYRINLLSEEEVEGIKVICIGNLTTGGVGKTPIVLEFAKFLTKNGNKVSTLSRGYGGKIKEASIVKNFEKRLIDDPSATGDEVRLIADNAENFMVTVSKDRVKGAKKAKSEGAKIIVMDDGFSNRGLKKDLTFALFDVEKFIGNKFLLPLGPLREPLGEIKRADGIILVNKQANKKCENLKDYLEKTFKKPVFEANFKGDYFYDIYTNEHFEPKKNSKAIAFCAIGQPEQFYDFLSDFKLIDAISFKDHHSYTKEDMKKIWDIKNNLEADYIFTTEKDAVKARNINLPINFSTKIYALKLKVEINVEEILKTFNFEG